MEASETGASSLSSIAAWLSPFLSIPDRFDPVLRPPPSSSFTAFSCAESSTRAERGGRPGEGRLGGGEEEEEVSRADTAACPLSVDLALCLSRRPGFEDDPPGLPLDEGRLGAT